MTISEATVVLSLQIQSFPSSSLKTLMATPAYSCCRASKLWYLPITCFFLFFHFRTSSSALILSLKNHHGSRSHSGGPMIQANSSCSLFTGAWIRDDSYPLYQYSDCSAAIDAEFNCQMYGRPDSGYQRYRWKPLNCELPRFNGGAFLERMRGKTVLFVGDSLGKNQWESLICMVMASVPGTSSQMVRGDPYSTFKFLDYGLSLSYYKARFLVDIDVVGGKRVLKLDDISGNAASWLNADVLSFNTGHWWIHDGSQQEWDVMESGGAYYQDMDRLVALERALRTWAHWVDSKVDTTRTRVFFQGISPTHYNANEWSAGATTATTKNCYRETTPISGTMYPGVYPEQMKVVDEVLGDMKRPPFLLDITLLSALRKDGHPSIYGGDLTSEQRANPDGSADCSHWCLPGIPDTWNILFYTALFYH